MHTRYMTVRSEAKVADRYRGGVVQSSISERELKTREKSRKAKKEGAGVYYKKEKLFFGADNRKR